MSDPTTIRLYEDDVLFLNRYSETKKIDRTKLIKELLHEKVESLKIENALADYKEGKRTIRECAELCRVDYRELLNELAKRGLIGGTAKLQQIMLKDTNEQLGNLPSEGGKSF